MQQQILLTLSLTVMEKSDWRYYKNILCIRLDAMGDVLMTTPAIRALKESAKGRKITLLTSTVGQKVTPYIPEIDEVIEYDVPWEKNDGQFQTNEFFSLIKILKERQFDAAVIFTSFSQDSFPAAIITYLAEIRCRLAYSTQNPFRLLTHYLPNTEPFTPLMHEVERQLHLAASIGATTKNTNLSFAINQQINHETNRILQIENIDSAKPFIVLHPGVYGAAKRQFAQEIFAQAAKQLVKELHFPIVITGSKSEEMLVNDIQQQIGSGSFSLAGKLTVGQLGALMKLSKLVITNNTGPMHIAAAVQTPIVALYARTNPQHTPWQVTNVVLYFDVPRQLQSKNPLLQYVVPNTSHSMPQAKDIVTAAKQMLRLSSQNKISKEVLTWQ